jgi:cell division protein ZapE
MPLREGLTNHPSLVQRYNDLAAKGSLDHDARQVDVARALDGLLDEISTKRLAAKKSSLGWLFAKHAGKDPVRGLYIHGSVGRGKTMLMDMFCEAAPVVRKRRAHFHEFMADVHERVRRFRDRQKSGELVNGDAIRMTADEIANETTLLCFDEFHVTDIADAMILGRLFERLFEHHVILVATSNVPPSDLYLDGLNRALFIPFIRMLEKHLDVMRLDARTDFRLEKLEGQAVWHVPADANAGRPVARRSHRDAAHRAPALRVPGAVSATLAGASRSDRVASAGSAGCRVLPAGPAGDGRPR